MSYLRAIRLKTQFYNTPCLLDSRQKFTNFLLAAIHKALSFRIILTARKTGEVEGNHPPCPRPPAFFPSDVAQKPGTNFMTLIVKPHQTLQKSVLFDCHAEQLLTQIDYAGGPTYPAGADLPEFGYPTTPADEPVFQNYLCQRPAA